MRELIAGEDRALMRLLAMLWIGGDPDDPDEEEDRPKPGPPRPNLR
jgi:hypothetical protein